MLAKIDCLDFLKIDYNPIMPEGVWKEISFYHDNVFKGVGETKERWLKVKSVTASEQLAILKREIGEGEAEVIAALTK